MPGFSLTLHPVECGPVEDVCRTVAYAAEQLGVRLAQVSCEPQKRRYRAHLVGADPHMDQLRTVLLTGFPGVKVALSGTDAPDALPPLLSAGSSSAT